MSGEMKTQRVGALMLAITCAAAVACSSKNDAANDSTRTAAGDVAHADSAAAPATATAPAPSTSMTLTTPTTDTGIVNVLNVVNQGEVEAGQLARSKASNAQVKSFAREMVTEHSAAMRKGSQLAKSAGIPVRPADSSAATTAGTAGTASGTDAVATLMRMHQDVMSRLNAASGADFDSAYVNSQVMGHQQVLDLLNQMSTTAQNAQLKQHVSSLIPDVQKHLERAQKLQATLSGGADSTRAGADTAKRGS